MSNETKEIIFKREELYKKVWEKPISRLAKEYGISDVGLAKICRKLKIPRPPRGYWAKLEYGKKVHRQALYNLKPDEPTEYKLSNQLKIEYSVSVDLKNPEGILNKKEITVPQRLSNPHRFVREAKALLEKQRPDDYGMLSVYRKPCLNIRVSLPILGRALRILDALVKGFEAEGIKVSTEENPKTASYAEIFGEKVYFSLVEHAIRKDHILVDEERLKQKTSSISYAKRYDYHPSGNLSLYIDIAVASRIRKRWSDSNKSQLEENIGEFINSAILVAQVLKEERLNREEERRKWIDERKREEEEEKRRKEEETRLHNLEMQAEQWAKSRQLRAYIRAVEREVARIEIDEEFRARFVRWLSWAKEHAERLNPIKRGLPKKPT